MAKNFVAGRSAEKERRWLMGAFDFETRGLDGEVLFGTLQSELVANGERTEIMDTYSADGMLDLLWENNKKKMRWYAHNMEFDAWFLIDAARHRLNRGELDKIVPCLRGMNKVYKVTFYRGDEKLEIYDSMALADMSLEKFAKAFSTLGNKHKTIDFEAGEIFDAANPDHVEYARQDTRVLLDSIINFNSAIYSHYGVNIKGTISSTALSAWEVTMPRGHIHFRLSPNLENFCRDAYKGGLVFLTDNKEHEDVVSLDVNSMYPHCMRKFGVPFRSPSRVETFDFSKPGVYRCKFIAPESLHMGCIGYKDVKGICWPRGEFESTAFGFEIERALAWGYQVELLVGFEWNELAYPFNDFVTLCETKRAEFSGQPVEMIFKLMQNSLYGKFGTKPEGEELCIFPDDAEIESGWRPFINDHANEFSANLEGVWVKTTERDAYYMMPHWAGWITANARGILFDVIEAGGGEVIYGDTDSAKMPRRVAERLIGEGKVSVGKDYGAMKVDEVYQILRPIAPKVYAYIDGHGSLGGKGKGIPKKHRTSEYWHSVMAGEKPSVTYYSLDGLKPSMKKGDRRLNTRTRASSDLANSASWFAQSDGTVKAIRIVGGQRIKL